MIDFEGTSPFLILEILGCHGNHAFTHSQNKFCIEDKKVLLSWGPNEQFVTHENCPGIGYKVCQIRSRGNPTGWVG